MPVVEQVLDDPSEYARIELAVATTLPSAQVARVFLWLATYPWHAVTWFGPGHSVRWYHEPSTFPLGGGDGHGGDGRFCCSTRPARARARAAGPVGFRVAGIPCAGCGSSRYRNGTGNSPSNSLGQPGANRLAAQQRSWIVGP